MFIWVLQDIVPQQKKSMRRYLKAYMVIAAVSRCVFMSLK